jgi:hypothetical protein
VGSSIRVRTHRTQTWRVRTQTTSVTTPLVMVAMGKFLMKSVRSQHNRNLPVQQLLLVVVAMDLQQRGSAALSLFHMVDLIFSIQVNLWDRDGSILKLGKLPKWCRIEYNDVRMQLQSDLIPI